MERRDNHLPGSRVEHVPEERGSTMVKKTLIGLMAASMATLALVTPASAAEVSWSLTPRVEPGGRVDADTHAAILGCGPATPVTSDGFAAPLQWTEGGN